MKARTQTGRVANAATPVLRNRTSQGKVQPRRQHPGRAGIAALAPPKDAWPVSKSARDKTRSRNAAPGALRHRQAAQLAKYFDLFDSAPVGYLTLGRVGAIGEINRAGASLLGTDRPRLLRRRLRRFVCPSDRPVFDRFRQELFGPQTRATCEVRLQTGREPVIWIRFEADRDPAQRHARVMLSDITERQRMEQELRATGQRLHFLLAETPALLYAGALDLPPRATFVSENIQALLGYEPAEVMGNPGFWLGRVHPDDAPGIHASFATLLRDGLSMWDYRLRDKAGTYHWLRDHVRLIRDARGRPAELLGCAVDITERKQAEAVQREQLAQIDAIYRTAPLGLCLLDTELRYVRVNQALVALNGLPAAEHLGRTVREVVPHLADTAEAIIRQIMATRQPLLHVEVTGATAAQPEVARSWMTHWSPVILPDDRLVGVNVVVQEITEQKRAEQALREARDQLERRVQERTAALQEALDLNRSMVAAAPVGIAAYQAGGRCVFANAALARIAGVSVEQLSRQDFRQLHSFEESGMRAMAETALTTGQPQAGEVHVRSSTGREFWAHCYDVPFTLGGQPHLLHMVHDISEQKRAERFLIAERDLSETLSSMDTIGPAAAHLLEVATQLHGLDSGGLYLVDPDNDGFRLCAHRGLSAGFIERNHFCASDCPKVRAVLPLLPFFGGLEQMPPPVAQDCRSEGLRSLAVIPIQHEGQLRAHLCVASHHHETIPQHARLALQTLAAQAAGAIVRIQSESARRASDQLLHVIIENTPIVVFAGNRDGIMSFEEGRALRNLGLKPGQNVGRHALEAYGDSPAIAESLRRVLAGEEVSALIELGPTSFEAWYTPLRDPAGQVNGYLGVALDVTERLRLERQIIEINDRMQTHFGQEIHDGLCQVLVGAAFDAYALQQDLADGAPTTESNLRRLRQLLDDAITDARRLARGLFPVKLDNCGLSDALRDLVESLGRHAGLRARFTENGSPVPTTDHGVAMHLFRIAQEALNNAIKHARARSLAVRLAHSHAGLTLTVADDGIGIPADARHGTGQGLHIMEYRARVLGGLLQIGARPGGGTQVLCRIPGSPSRRGIHDKVARAP
jgi:PAS domain S-box-containing protein